MVKLETAPRVSRFREVIEDILVNITASILQCTDIHAYIHIHTHALAYIQTYKQTA